MIGAVDSVMMSNVDAGDQQNLIDFLVIYLIERNQEHVTVNVVAIHRIHLMKMSIVDSGDQQILIDFAIYLTKILVKFRGHVKVKLVAIHRLQPIMMSIVDSADQQSLIDLVIYSTELQGRTQELATLNLVAIQRLLVANIFRVALQHLQCDPCRYNYHVAARHDNLILCVVTFLILSGVEKMEAISTTFVVRVTTYVDPMSKTTFPPFEKIGNPYDRFAWTSWSSSDRFCSYWNDASYLDHSW